MRIYFAHPMGQYGSSYEQLCLEAIKAKFPGIPVINPSDAKHAARYKKSGGRGMKFWKELAATCDLLVAVPFTDDGEHGAGVWAEIEAMHMGRGGLTLELHLGNWRVVNFADIRPLSVSETRRRNRAVKGFT